MAVNTLSFRLAPLDLRSPAGGDPVATVAAPGAAEGEAALELSTLALEYPGVTPVNDSFTLHFNRDGDDAAQPAWTGMFGSRRASSLPPGGVLEKCSEYAEPGGGTTYFARMALLDLNDGRMTESTVARSWAVLPLHDGAPADAAYELTTGNTTAEGEARFRRPVEMRLNGTKLVAGTAALGHRATFGIDSSFTHGVCELRPARYTGNTPQGFSYVNLSSRRVEVRPDAGQPTALAFRGTGTGGDSVGLRLSAGSKVLHLAAAGISGTPSGWSFNPAYGQWMAAGTLVVGGSPGAPADGLGVLGLGEAATAPAANPTGGGVLYVSGGALKYRGSAGTVTTLAP